MKNLRILGILAMLGLLILGATGCGETGGVTGSEQVAVDDYDDMDLNKAYGGLTMTDEADGFGDTYYTETEYMYEDAASDDPLQDDAEVQMYEDEVANGDPTDPNRPTITVVRLLWGQLDGLVEDIDEDFDALDWSGMLRVDRGIVLVRRVILFERPWDSLVRPRIDRHTVAWFSHTGPHFDGLIVQIIEPPVEPGPEGDLPPVNMLHLSTPQISLDYPMPEVSGLDETYPVDEQGNALRIEGHLLTDVDLCPKGFLSGIWVSDPQYDEDGNLIANGYFKGRWVGIWGGVKGLLRGRYGVNDAGENVFFGKYVSRNGQFRGLLSGTYGPTGDPGHGVFQGEWINAAETVEGVLGGQYFQIPDRPGGFFAGRWATLCDQDAVESIK
ncbi:hypothetical protein KKG45_08855 [bacterium]|nr:hypothetical protein [bacterium]MBU1073343.1 hypothetical protein [bacterium]MBU1675261.1 hypothetical protein [bacterium]